MDADLELVVGGQPVRFPAVWLRDNCPCPDCLAPGTGQKLKDITDIPNGLAITRTEDAGESVLVTFAPDQHRSAFSRTWLEAHALGDDADGDGRTEDDKGLWLPADLGPETGLPAMRSRRASATSGRRTTAGCSTCGWNQLPATWPSPAGRSGRTPTTRTATRRRPCSCCTACARPGKGETPGWWTDSRPPPIFAPPTRNRSARWREPPFRSVMSIKKPTYGRACRSSSSARPAGSAGSASTTGRCGRCGGRTPRSPRSTPPTGGGLSCWPSPDGSSPCGWRPGTAWSSTTPGCCTPAPPSA